MIADAIACEVAVLWMAEVMTGANTSHRTVDGSTFRFFVRPHRGALRDTAVRVTLTDARCVDVHISHEAVAMPQRQALDHARYAIGALCEDMLAEIG